jgi:chromosome partitioning protein
VTKVISLVNQKGGVGKTTLSVCLAYESYLSGNRTLLVDVDPQGSIMSWLDKRLCDLPDKLMVIAMPKVNLKRGLKNIKYDFDTIIIDTPPRTADLTISAILESDVVVVPCTPSLYDVWATKETIVLIRDSLAYNEDRKFVFAINRKIVGTVIGRVTRKAIQNLGDDLKIMTSEVSQRVVFAETAAIGLAVQECQKQNDIHGKAQAEISLLYNQIWDYTHNTNNGGNNEKNYITGQ